MLAKTHNGEVLQWPYDYAHLQADNPYTRFATGDVVAAFDGTEAWQGGSRLVDVVIAERPSYDERTERLVQDAPVLIDGQWVSGWNIVAKSEEEIFSSDAAKERAVRSERNSRLSACDWTQVADAPVDKAAWATYRQALRDVPSQDGFPWEIVWPVEP